MRRLERLVIARNRRTLGRSYRLRPIPFFRHGRRALIDVRCWPILASADRQSDAAADHRCDRQDAKQPRTQITLQCLSWHFCDLVWCELVDQDQRQSEDADQEQEGKEGDFTGNTRQGSDKLRSPRFLLHGVGKRGMADYVYSVAGAIRQNSPVRSASIVLNR